jgi:tRNA(Ile)-lysidine synthetase-like protein
MIQTVYDEALGRDAHRTPTAALSSAHLEALTELARRAVPESTLSLPCGMRALVRNGGLYFRASEPLSVSEPPFEPIPLGEGRTPWDDRTAITVELSPTPLAPLQGGDVFASAVFPAELPMPLLARRREAGDAILSHGMHKKLKKLLCDQDIPPHLRDRLPLICLPDGDPLWYPGAVFRDGYPAPASGPCVRVTVRRNSCQLPEI